MTLALALPPCPASVLSRLDPRWKLTTALLAAVTAALMRTLPALGLALAGSLLLVALARLPRTWYVERIGALALALALFVLPLPFLLAGDGPTWRWGWVEFSWHGARAGLLLAGKALAIVHVMLALLAATPLDALCKAGRSLGVPAVLVHLALLTYRYLFLLADELRRLRVALRVRGFRNRATGRSYRLIGQLAGILLVRGAERADRVGQAMRCRGFDGRVRSCTAFHTTMADLLAFGVVLSATAGLFALDHLGLCEAAVQAEPLIAVRNLVYAYPRGLRALDGVTFAADAGERIGLVGPNGAGKTSLFLCLAGVLTARAECLRLAGLDLLDAGQRKKLPAVVGIVFQHSDDQLFNATVFDDVAFGPLNLGLPVDEVRRRVAEALGKVGLVGVDERPPFHLSGGEKRRVALAGVLAMQPRVLLLDEPSTDLDPRGRRELIGLLNQLPGTRILSSHDLELVLATCDRVLLLDAGRLVTDGLARQVLADAVLMEAHGLEVPHSLRGQPV